MPRRGVVVGWQTSPGLGRVRLESAGEREPRPWAPEVVRPEGAALTLGT